jgi:CHAD domain-containing protein
MTGASETPQAPATRGGAAAAMTMAGPFLVSKLRMLDDRLQGAAPRVLASSSDENAVHDLRVALRRTRTVLEVGRGVLGRFHADEVRRSLREVHRTSGGLRDEEVFLELFAKLGVDDPGVGPWLDTRRARERHLRRALIKSLESGKLDGGRRMLAALLTFPVKPSRDKRLGKLARRAVDRARRDVLRLRAAPMDDPEALHRLRIAYKRLRYVVETFAEALTPELAALAQPAARFQSRLGDLHDVDVAMVAVKRARALSEGARGHLVTALERVRVERMAAYAREIGLVNIAPAPPVKAAPPPVSKPSSEANGSLHVAAPPRGRRIASR